MRSGHRFPRGTLQMPKGRTRLTQRIGPYASPVHGASRKAAQVKGRAQEGHEVGKWRRIFRDAQAKNP